MYLLDCLLNDSALLLFFFIYSLCKYRNWSENAERSAIAKFIFVKLRNLIIVFYRRSVTNIFRFSNGKKVFLKRYSFLIRNNNNNNSRRVRVGMGGVGKKKGRGRLENKRRMLTEKNKCPFPPWSIGDTFSERSSLWSIGWDNELGVCVCGVVLWDSLASASLPKVDISLTDGSRQVRQLWKEESGFLAVVQRRINNIFHVLLNTNHTFMKIMWLIKITTEGDSYRVSPPLRNDQPQDHDLIFELKQTSSRHSLSLRFPNIHRLISIMHFAQKEFIYLFIYLQIINFLQII